MTVEPELIDPLSSNPPLQSPSFVFASKTLEKLSSVQNTPGPAAYKPLDKVYRNGRDPTRNSIVMTRKVPKRMDSSPGPAAYPPVACHRLSNHPSPPSFSISLPLTSEKPKKYPKTPAPNAYQLDKMLGRMVRSNKRSGPEFSLGIRTGSCFEAKAKSPGPATYNLPSPSQLGPKSPSFSLSSRHHLVPKQFNSGPASHSIDKSLRILSHVRSAPAFSFGMRHSQSVLTFNK